MQKKLLKRHPSKPLNCHASVFDLKTEILALFCTDSGKRSWFCAVSFSTSWGLYILSVAHTPLGNLEILAIDSAKNAQVGLCFAKFHG